MLTLLEKILFFVALSTSLVASFWITDRIRRIINRGAGQVNWKLAQKRLGEVLVKVITLQPTFRLRIGPSIFHALIAWGFLYYLLVNLGDVLEGYISGFTFLGKGVLGNLYRLGADILSVGVLTGMLFMLTRRFIFRTVTLSTREDVLLDPKARSGIRRDSAIVGVFILFHIGSRLMGETFSIGLHGKDPWQPFASTLSKLWTGMNGSTLVVAEHVTFWLALGSILAFIPYFLYSKHIHLFITPLNFLLKPERLSIGELNKLDFDDESIEQFGAERVEELGWEQLMDAYACIMCYRCQEVCPAYNTGKVLSPAALEINKRYFFNSQGANLAKGDPSNRGLLDFAIPSSAIWACTTCGACVDICPVNNEPMRDILDIRRHLVLMENDFPDPLQAAFRGMERTVNPWNIAPAERMKWAEGLHVPTIEQVPEPDILWWVGCAPATDPRAQKTAVAFTKILNSAGVNFAVLGKQEQCTGDSARRAGNEFLFNELATANVEILNELAPKRIVTTCPHCLHTIKNEYPAFGGNYDVIHHTQLIHELISTGKLALNNKSLASITYHDPCYLARHNHLVEEPRAVLEKTGANLKEMERHGRLAFCCGAGGAQMWKEEEEGKERVNANRFREAQKTNCDTLAVSCPFCMIMLNDAGKDAHSEMKILDIAEIIAAQLVEKS